MNLKKLSTFCIQWQRRLLYNIYLHLMDTKSIFNLVTLTNNIMSNNNWIQAILTDLEL